MTSPGIPKPPGTSDTYDDVYSRGSSFGAELSENSVRDLLIGGGTSIFGQILNAIGGLINDIAMAISGNGGARMGAISGAVEQRLGPLNTAITEQGEDFEDLATRADAHIDAQEAINTTVNTDLWNHQININRLVQAQLWNHQDTLEQLDIRAMKHWGWGVNEYHGRRANPYDGNAVQDWWSTPYVEVWRTDDKTILVACLGTWTGTLHVATNWDNGALDDWTVDISPGGNRLWGFSGGAAIGGPSMRHISIEVLPKSLNREVLATPHGGSWTINEDINNLIRYEDPDGEFIRLRNTVRANRPVVILSEEGVLQTIPAGGRIPSTEIYAAEQTNGVVIVFTEESDPAWDYTVPGGRPTM